MAPTLGRAPCVCDVCRNRKRTCDKRLPACSYCSKKGLVCVYTNRTSERKVGNLYSMKATFDAALSNSGRLHLSGLNAVSTRNVIHKEVLDYLKSIGVLPSEVAALYFDGFHRWLLIVDPLAFDPSSNNAERTPQQTGFSLLLLAMTLIVSPELKLRTDSKTVNCHGIYLRTKMLFAQAQMMNPHSVLVIQAGLLICAFEYVCRNMEAAYVTVSTCMAMSRLVPPFDQTSEHGNVWLSLFVLQMIIRCEAPLTYQRASDSIEIDRDPFSGDYTGDITPTMQDQTLYNPDCFIRLIQATSLLHKVSRLVHISKFDLEATKRLDAELRAFLNYVLNEAAEDGLRTVGAISVLIRALFLLYEAKPPDSMAQNETYRAKRTAALDCVTRLMVDVARTNTHASHPIRLNRHPYTGVYNVQAAIRYLNAKMQVNETDATALEALTDLHALESLYDARWIRFNPAA